MDKIHALGRGNQRLYDTADPARDSRIAELQAILRIVRAWYQWSEHEGQLSGWTAAETHARFLSHQIFYDIQTMIEGFIGLVAYREQRWGAASIRARQITQDSLESLFGRLRYSCGGADAVSMARAVRALPREDERTQVRWRQQTAHQRDRFNSGRVGEGFDLPDRCRIVLPADFDQQLAAALSTTAPAVAGVSAYPIFWKTLSDIVAADEYHFKTYGRARVIYWLSVSRHMVLTGFSC